MVNQRRLQEGQLMRPKYFVAIFRFKLGAIWLRDTFRKTNVNSSTVQHQILSIVPLQYCHILVNSNSFQVSCVNSNHPVSFLFCHKMSLWLQNAMQMMQYSSLMICDLGAMGKAAGPHFQVCSKKYSYNSPEDGDRLIDPGG